MAELPVTSHRAVLLQPSYRIELGKPVVFLYGRTEADETVLVKAHDEVPHFYVRRADVPRLGKILPAPPVDDNRSTMAGEAVVRVDVAIPADTSPLRERIAQEQVDTFEADVRFAMRFLIDRNIKGSFRITGASQPGDGVDRVFLNPELQPCVVEVTPKVLSFDIETNPRTDRLLAIALYGCGIEEALIVDADHRSMPANARGFADEQSVLNAFCQRVAELDPDILTGWNVIDFDLAFLLRCAARLRYPFCLGRTDARNHRTDVRIRAARGYFGSGHATIPGRLVLDGMDLVRGAFIRMDEYSLDSVAREVLGEGKVLEGDVKDRVGEILYRYANDLPGFADYACADARLALQIGETLDLFRLAFTRSRFTGMPPDRVAASIASFDFLYLAELHQRRCVAPTLRPPDTVRSPQAGGHVFEPLPGVYEDVWVFDFKSLYPSIIRTFNIDPCGFVATAEDASDDELIVLPEACFQRAPAILPKMLDALFPQREAAKKEGDSVASQAIKILMNSFYGVLGTSACRFHNPAIANAITGQGRRLLQWTKAWFEDAGYQVLYGDTDSVFILSPGSAAGSDPQRLGAELAQAANVAVAQYVNEGWRVSSRLELEFEKLYAKLFLPAVRGGSVGARKRYVGLPAGTQALEFVGMEVVRRDWTELAKTVQREIYARLFGGVAVEDYLAGIVTQVRAGKLNDLLTYRKGLRKSLESYTANTPPHVAAARKSKEPLGRVVSYVMTLSGPEPLDNLQHDLDLEHYIEKQVRPVAEPVLETLGLRFAQVVGDDRQLGLF